MGGLGQARSLPSGPPPNRPTGHKSKLAALALVLRARTYSPRAAWCFAPAFTASDLCENYGVPKGTCPEDQGGGITRRAE